MRLVRRARLLPYNSAMLARARERLKAAAKIRWLVVAATILLTASTALAILGTAFWGWHFGLGHADLASRINTVVAVCAFILVTATLFVALIAYLAATGQPVLEAELSFSFAQPNRPVFQASKELSPKFKDCRAISPWREQAQIQINIYNRSRYSARNPGMRIHLWGLGGLSDQPGWTVINTLGDRGPSAIQWDGGADFLIHGNWSRVLPRLDLTDVAVVGNNPALMVIVAADGVKPKELKLPVRVLDYDDFWDYINNLDWSWSMPDRPKQPRGLKTRLANYRKMRRRRRGKAIWRDFLP